MSTSNEIKKVAQRILGLVDKLVQTKDMVKGSFSIVYRKCGKPTCWCADEAEKGHISTRITWNENGLSRTRTVADADQEQLKNATEAYRAYRQRRRVLRMEENLLENLIDKHEIEILNNQ